MPHTPIPPIPVPPSEAWAIMTWSHTWNTWEWVPRTFTTNREQAVKHLQELRETNPSAPYHLVRETRTRVTEDN